MQQTLNKGWAQRNTSNITFGKEFIDKHTKTQQNYRSFSKVGNMMKDQIDEPRGIKTYTFDNKISQVNKEFAVPQYEGAIFQRNNKQYEDFLYRRKKFKKPYSECTKFVDNLMKNKSLLRRGQFETPIPNEICGKSFENNALKTQKTQFFRSSALTKKHSLTMQKIKSSKESSDLKKGFNKTITNYNKSYEKLLKHNRQSKGERIEFKNSMNRILAAQMIEYRVLQSGESMRHRNIVKSKY